MSKIRWKYVTALAVGMLFIVCFGAALFSMGQLWGREEDFVFIYEDQETARKLVNESEKYGIHSELAMNAGENPDKEANKETNKETTAVIVTDTGSLDYQNVVSYFQNKDGSMDTGLFAWLNRFEFMLFTSGVGFLFYKRQQGSGWYFTATVPVWLLFLKCVPGQAAFPIWLLPGKWSDFEGWKGLWNLVKSQFAALVQYQKLSIVEAYHDSVLAGVGFLGLSFVLIVMYHKCCSRLKLSFFVHGIMAVSAFLWYIKIADMEIKGLIYFFPCYLAAQYLTEYCRKNAQEP